MNQHYPFTLMPLPYDDCALEPVLDQTTLCFHHDKHLKTYVDNLNTALKDYPQLHSLDLTELIKQAETFPEEIRTPVKNNAGGVYNHQLYFNCMAKEIEINEFVREALERNFGSIENWSQQMRQAALGQFGSGWAWLVRDMNGQLKVMNTANQDTPLPINMIPILLVDVWEHAYYLQYQNRRADYVDNWFSIINWNLVEENLKK